MPTRDWKFRILDMLGCIERVRTYIAGMTLEEFSADPKTVDAVVHNIEIIGEAANHVPIHIQEKYPDIEWIDIVGMRNLIIHGYFFIDHRIVWRVASERLTKLEAALLRIRDAESI